MNNQITKICCIGAGYVGGPSMAVFADHCKDIQIKVVDINQSRIDSWNNEDISKIPVFEPGLDEIISRTRGRNLHFSTKIKDAIAEADMIFLSVNTPTKLKGLGAGKASDLKFIEASARMIAENAQNHTIVVEKSTLPVRTAETIKIILDSNIYQEDSLDDKKTFSVLSNPEFLAEGTAINDLNYPDRILIGGDDETAIDLLSNIYQNWVPENKILRTNLWSSELSKLAANAFLAQRISSINSISAFCEVSGANIHDVSKAIGTDSRIGDKFLIPGPGFGGSCFQKDIFNLVYLSSYFGLDEVANYWEQVVLINNWQKKRISNLIIKNLFGTVSDKIICILGFSFKANTNDTRESPAINISEDLLEEGAKLSIFDPKVSKKQILVDLKLRLNNNSTFQENISNSVNIFGDLYDASKNADAIVITTDWDEFKNINWNIISKNMRKPSWIFDLRNCTDDFECQKYGLKVWKLGVSKT